MLAPGQTLRFVLCGRGSAVRRNGKPEQNFSKEHLHGYNTEEVKKDSKTRPYEPEESADGPLNQKLHFKFHRG